MRNISEQRSILGKHSSKILYTVNNATVSQMHVGWCCTQLSAADVFVIMHKRTHKNDSSFCISVTEHQYVLGT